MASMEALGLKDGVPSYNPSAEWCKLHNRCYSKREVYTMAWPPGTNLAQLTAACARFGGPIATVRDDRQVLLLGGAAPVRPVVRIHTAAGRLLSEVAWDKGKLVRMGWTDEESLACVLEDGTVQLYSQHGELLTQFGMGDECNDYGVVEAVVWGGGVVVLTARNRLYAARFGEPRPRALADPGLDGQPPTCMAVREPRHTLSGGVEVLLGTPEGSILVIDEATCEDKALTNGPFVRLAISGDGNYLAAFSETGSVWVAHSDFSKSISEFGTQIKVPPKQLDWCGSDSVVMHWDELLLMVGPFGDWIKYAYEEALVLVPEVDGVRVVTSKTTEFLQMVPPSTLSIFQIGSTDPPAMLFDAFEQFERRSAKADENVREIRSRGQLNAAIDGCIDAATHELEFEQQRALLRAASFGKCFADLYPAERFVSACRTLRVLNAVRHHSIGIPLSPAQLQALTTDTLVSRLVNAHHHLLALRISEHLGLAPDRVLIHWAIARIRAPPAKSARQALSDADLASEIVGRLRIRPGISYAEVASAAFQAGREDLAALLLDHEPRASRQVPLLISMRRGVRALDKAIASGDTDLVFLSVLHLKAEMEQSSFFDVIANRPAARDLLVMYCRSQDVETLKTLYYHLDKRVSAGQLCVLEAYARSTLKQRMDGMRIATEFYGSADAFSAKATEEQTRLLGLQAELEAEFNNRARSGEASLFVDRSVNETVHSLLLLGKMRQAEKVAAQMKVPDKRLCWIKARAFVQMQAWDQLERLATQRKSPIGMQPFVELCVEAGNSVEAAKYIALLPQVSERMHWFIQIRYLREAAEIAVRLKDNDCIALIRSKMDDNQVGFLDQLIAAAAEQK